MGIVDLLSIIPTYLVFIYPPIRFMLDIRVIRLIRIFRVFKLSRYLRGANVMQIASNYNNKKFAIDLMRGALAELESEHFVETGNKLS